MATEKPRCKARSSRTGKPCNNYPIHGGVVCTKHGGSAPQVKRAARNRLLDIIDPDRVFREMARIGFSDPTAVFDDKGNIRPVGEWPESLKRAVAAVEVVKRNVDSGDGKIDDVIKVKFWDKPKALEQMAKVLQMFVERVEVTAKVDIEQRLAAGRQRVADARSR